MVANVIYRGPVEREPESRLLSAGDLSVTLPDSKSRDEVGAMARALFEVRRPTVGLLNVGVEEIKGQEEVKAAGQLIRAGATLPVWRTRAQTRHRCAQASEGGPTLVEFGFHGVEGGVQFWLTFARVAGTGAVWRKTRQGDFVVTQLGNQAHHGRTDFCRAGLVAILHNTGQFGRTEGPPQRIVEGIWLCHDYPAGGLQYPYHKGAAGQAPAGLIMRCNIPCGSIQQTAAQRAINRLQHRLGGGWRSTVGVDHHIANLLAGLQILRGNIHARG